MITEKLYDIDSHLSTFDATVLSCAQENGEYIITLDRTAFFPEAGGQPSDKGVIDGVKVHYVSIEENQIFHHTKEPITVGKHIVGTIDFTRRHRFMQNHTGEHIISGILHAMYGFSNVGFHLNEEFATLDFNGELTRTQLDEVEQLANQKVWNNLAVRCYYPTPDELSALEYRSKKELEGDIRIVEITDTDMCACCAPHVKNTGEIGIIKLLDTERMRGGTRVILKCGDYALADYRKKYENAVHISALLSAKQDEIAVAVDALQSKLDGEKEAHTQAVGRMLSFMIASASTNVIFADNLDTKELQMLADGLHKTKGGLCGAFSKREQGYAFAICNEDVALQTFFADFKTKLTVRGGGRGGMVQGTVFADKEQIKLFF